jgi:hypothetical protein
MLNTKTVFYYIWRRNQRRFSCSSFASLPRQRQCVFPGKDANYEGVGTLCYQGAETPVASAKGRHQGPNKAQVRASEDWIVVSMNHRHVDLSNVANYNTCVKTKQALRI